MQLTLNKLSERYNIEFGKLKFFADNDLIEIKQSYNPEDEKKLSIVCTLYETGMSVEEIKKFFTLKGRVEEQIKLLTLTRNNLLESIHTRQQSLDQLDYMLYKLKNIKKNETHTI